MTTEMNEITTNTSHVAPVPFSGNVVMRFTIIEIDGDEVYWSTTNGCIEDGEFEPYGQVNEEWTSAANVRAWIGRSIS
jgi:hypothetical protein